MSTVESFVFGSAGKKEVRGFRLRNRQGMLVEVIEYGARIRSIRLPGAGGKDEEVTVGFDSLAPYLDFNLYFGAIIGRTAGRTSAAPFSLDGQEWTLSANAGGAHQHGGALGFDKVFWKGTEEASGQEAAVRMSYTAAHLEEGYPGECSVELVYTLDDENRFSIACSAKADRITPIDMTSHVYLNLNGVRNQTVQNELLWVNASHYLNKTPTSAADLILPVAGTPFDIRHPRTLADLSGNALYNPVMILDGDPALVREVARVSLPSRKRSYTLSATGAAMQVYNAFNLPAAMAANGVSSDLPAACGLCLEAQGIPDAVHHPHLRQSLLRPGEKYHHEMRFAFTF